MERKSNYPFVLVAGLLSYGEEEFLSRFLPYFGLWKTDVRKLYRDKDVRCYIPSLGPFSSAWDKACELYAAIVGGTVDYGKAHSEKHGHERYGRTYRQALIPEWGKLDAEGKLQKINLIGYSLGAPVMRVFVELLVSGSQEEREVTPEYSLSELFRGGHEEWVHSVTSLCGAHEGTTAVYLLQKFKVLNLLLYLAALCCCLLGHTPLAAIFDPRLDQFNLSVEPGTSWMPRIKFKKIKQFVRSNDNVVCDCFPHVARERNETFTNKTYDNIYYFSYSADATIKHKKSYKVRKGVLKKFFPLLVTTWFLIHYKSKSVDQKTGEIIYSDIWCPNDGGVNLISNIAPFGDPQEELLPETLIKTGVWYTVVEEGKTHMSYSGLGEKDKVHKKFYLDLLNRINSLDTNGATMVLQSTGYSFLPQ